VTARRTIAITAGALLLAGCTFTPGSAFSSLSSATLQVNFLPGEGRLDTEGRLKTDLGYRVTLTDLSLTTEDLVVQSRSATAPTSSQTAAVAFDPAKPPAGYTLCHGGHCHRQDGALVDYADVQAEMAGGTTASLTDVLRLSFNAILNLQAIPQRTITSSQPTASPLGQATWNRAELRCHRLVASGTVVDGTPDQRLGNGGPMPWQLSWSPPTLGKNIDLTISRKSPPTMQVIAKLQVSDQLFDRIDWATLPTGATPLILDDQPAVTRQLTENFGQSTLTVDLEALP
jgi:hypothetical protein